MEGEAVPFNLVIIYLITIANGEINSYYVSSAVMRCEVYNITYIAF